MISMRMFVIASMILLLDQLSKQLVLRVLTLPMWFISDDVGLQLSYNTGVAFSLPVRGLFAAALSIVIIIFLLVFFLRGTNKGILTDLAFGFIIGGALGNLLDRFLHGAVIDFFSVYSWPAFNIADAAITIGFLLFVFRLDTIASKRFSLF